MAWRPLADIYRTPDGWAIKLELAGVCPEDVTVVTRGSQVYISGCRRDRIIEADWSLYAMEIAYCHFERVIELPDELERAFISLECREGLLIVRLALSEENQR
jgi:HSP20 family protein